VSQAEASRGYSRDERDASGFHPILHIFQRAQLSVDALSHEGEQNPAEQSCGYTSSKVKQAQLRRQQAQIDLSVTQKTLAGNLAAYYAEAQVAQNQIASLRSSADLAQESLRLTVLRYQAGEATALEVVDAQNTLNLARNAYEDGLLRFRVALGNLQTLTGRL